MKEYKFNITLSPTEPRPVEPHKLVIPLMGVDAHLVTLKMGHTQVSEDKKWFAEMTVTKGSALSDEFWEANGEKITEYVAQTMSEFIIEKEIPNEQKPIKWSEEDSRKIGTLSGIIFDYAFHKDALDENNDLIGEYAELDNWLGTIPERFNLQPKQEWSEEDELMFKQAIYVCHQNGYTAVENWLKSLKPQSKLKS